MEIQKATRKSFPVEVVQVTLQNIEELAEWCNGSIEQRPTKILGTFADLPVIRIKGQGDSRGKEFEASLGCWIVNLRGSFRSYKPSQFESSFDILPETEPEFKDDPVDTYKDKVQNALDGLTEGDVAIYDSGEDGPSNPDTYLKIV